MRQSIARFGLAFQVVHSIFLIVPTLRLTKDKVDPGSFMRKLFRS
jgi:hypothetical protein